MKRLVPSVLIGALVLTACGTNPDDLTRDERVQIDSACMSAVNQGVAKEWGGGGGWTTFGEWSIEKGNDGFKTTGEYDSDVTGAVPVSCEVTYPEMEVIAHEVGAPAVDLKAAAIDACHQSVLDDARYPSDVEFISTDVSENVIRGPADTRQFGISGDVDIPNAFGTKSRQGYLCAGVIVNPDGSVRHASAAVSEFFRSRS